MAPTIAARAAATIDQLSGGRLALHIIVGNSDADQQREGDFSPKEERYARAAEYLDVMRKVWTSTKPFDYEGRFYRFKDVFSEAKPFQQPLSAAVLRWLLAGRDGDGRAALRCLRHVR